MIGHVCSLDLAIEHNLSILGNAWSTHIAVIMMLTWREVEQQQVLYAILHGSCHWHCQRPWYSMGLTSMLAVCKVCSVAVLILGLGFRESGGLKLIVSATICWPGRWGHALSSHARLRCMTSRPMLQGRPCHTVGLCGLWISTGLVWR